VPTTRKGDSEREAWLDDARRRGFTVKVAPLSYGTVRRVNEKLTNIKYSQVVQNRARFALGNKFLRTMDIFVLICEDHHHFYSFKRDKMNWLADRTTRDASYDLPEFNINIASQEYYSGSKVFPIRDNRDDWSVFKS